jgi:hypothetical protein
MCCELKVHWALDIHNLKLLGLDGFGDRKVKYGLEMDQTRLEWTLVGHLPFGFGTRSNSMFSH